MNTTAQKSWPKTAEGTTDWEVVFEAPDGGLVQLVTQAQSLDALNECASVVIRSLFTRKGDEAEVIRFKKLLDQAIAKGRDTDDVINTRTSVEFLLRRIKQERIDKAKAYIAQKNSKQAIERRAKKADKDKSRMMAIAAGVAFVVISGGVAAWLLSNPTELADKANPSDVTTKPDPNWTPAARETFAESEKPAPEPAPKKKPEKSTKAKKPPPQNTYPKTVMLKPFYWSYAGKGGRRKYISYQPVIVVPESPQYRTVCVNAPWVTDAIYLVFSRIHPRDRLASEKELARVGQRSASKINKRYGKGTVGDISFVSNTDQRFRSSVMRCELENS